MESILARALEYTLKYWLKSFSRDQFKLQGHTVQLSNLDLNGDALHSSVGLPPAINVATAKVAKLEIMLPSVSNVQIEPIIVQIDRLDLVLEENSHFDPAESPTSSTPSSATTKGSGYGFADKIADGMTIQIHTVNLLLETHGSARRQGGATWAPPMASVTIRNLLLYTTNESWQVVNLKEAREFSTNTKYIYVFKKLEWESLSIDLLPHPDMFTDATLGRSQEGANLRDDDGAKRVFFGGERFIEGISGEAYITIQRTELNSPLGLEVQLHVTEAVCPALSEPGLRALLRFMTGLYVCQNRGDVNFKAQQRLTEAAGRSLVSIVVDHIFLCIKDSEFQLELLMQSLFFSRASLSDGDDDSNLTRITIAGLFLRDTFSRPPCTLVQPSMQSVTGDAFQVPEFGAQEMAERWWFSSHEDVRREERSWHTTFHSLQLKAKGSPKNVPGGKTQSHRIRQYPVELVTIGVHGLRILKPHTQKDITSSNGVKEFTDTVGGIGLEVRLILCADNVDDEMANWEVENLKFSIMQPIEAVVTKDEVQHLTFLCKSEIDSIGRITAGILRLLKLEGSVGHSVMDQLGNLGSEGIDKIFSPERLSRDGSVYNRGLSPLPNVINGSPHKSMEPTLTLLEEAVMDSQAKVNALITDIGTSDSTFQHLTVVEQLSQKIESMQGLLLQLRNQI